MESFGQYLRSRRESRGMTLEELANKAKVSPSLLSKIERGQRGIPKMERLQSLADALGVEMTEIMTVAQQERQETTEPRQKQSQVPIQNFYYKFQKAEIMPVPLIRDIKVGQPWWREDFNIGTSFFIKGEVYDGDGYLDLEVTDDHMQGDGILPGSSVLVKISSDVPHGEIALVSIKGDRKATLRRLHYAMELDCLVLQASNPKITPRVIPLHELGKSIEIIGQAVQLRTIL